MSGQRRADITRRRLVAAVILLALVAGGVAAAIVIAGGGDDGEQGGAAGLPEGCEPVSEPAPRNVDLDRPRTLEPRAQAAVVETSCGSFEIALAVRQAPRTVASFEHMVQEGIYDGTLFHRIVPRFVVQGGDPKGDGTGGPGYSVDEPPPGNLSYTAGTVAMAKTEVEPPGRSGSQFFVVVATDAGLPPDFALLGRVAEGMDVVERIAALGTEEVGREGEPRAPVLIERIELRRGG